VTRRFGIGQFQPEVNVYARTKRWKVIGLDTSSPWNPRSEGPTWEYRVCNTCNLRYNAAQSRCPRCKTMAPGTALPSYDFAGFLASRNENPILDDEERYADRNLVKTYPQWDGDVVARWTIGSRWANEGRPPSPKELEVGALMLHPEAKGYLLCPSCGRLLPPPELDSKKTSGKKNTKKGNKKDDNNGHTDMCPNRGSLARPLAISTAGHVEILRLLVPVPANSEENQWD